MTQAKAGDTVRIHYRGTLDDGSEFDSSAGRDPLEFTLGGGQVIPGFDDAVTGMTVGESKTVTIPPEEAYGEKNPGVSISYGRELGLHPNMIAAFEARILEALGVDHVHDGDLYDTMLVVVGRGTSDTMANAEAARLTRIVTENLGFGWSETV